MNGSSGFSLDTICLFLFEVVQSSKQGKLEGGYTRDGGGGGLIISCLFWFTGRWAYNRGGGGLISGGAYKEHCLWYFNSQHVQYTEHSMLMFLGKKNIYSLIFSQISLINQYMYIIIILPQSLKIINH